MDTGNCLCFSLCLCFNRRCARHVVGGKEAKLLGLLRSGRETSKPTARVKEASGGDAQVRKRLRSEPLAPVTP